MAPDITSVEPNSGVEGTFIQISGNYFSTKKGKVYLEDPDTGKRKNCKVTSWDMNSIMFVAPKASKNFLPGNLPLEGDEQGGVSGHNLHDRPLAMA